MHVFAPQTARTHFGQDIMADELARQKAGKWNCFGLEKQEGPGVPN